MIRLDLIRQAVSGTPGTGAISLGTAQTGYIGIQDHPDTTNGMLVEYVIKDGDDKEFGIGTFATTGNVLTRTWIQGKIASGVYSKNPATGLSLTSAAIVSCGPVATNLNFHGCLITKSGNDSVTNGAVVLVSFDVEQYDTLGFHDNVTNNSRITIPSNSGIRKIRLKANVIWDANTSGYRFIRLYKNGSAGFPGNPTSLMQAATYVGASNMQNISSPVIDVADGDYFELMVQQTSGATINVTASSGLTWFGCEVVG